MPPRSQAFKIGWTFAGFSLYSLTAYVSYHAYKIYTLPSPETNAFDPSKQPNVTSRYSLISKQYDSSVGWDEFLLGIASKRQRLLREAHGQVLEVSAGTGLNLPHYPTETNQIQSLAISDLNLSMLEEASKKRYIANKKQYKFPISFHQMDAASLPLPDDSVDTIVDTFGLCSMPDPNQALLEMKRVLKKQTGRLLLLEHGRTGKHPLLDLTLDKTAPMHAEKWGCHWNRDILSLLESNGWDVVHMETSHFGTTYSLICVPSASASLLPSASSI